MKKPPRFNDIDSIVSYEEYDHNMRPVTGSIPWRLTWSDEDGGWIKNEKLTLKETVKAIECERDECTREIDQRVVDKIQSTRNR